MLKTSNTMKNLLLALTSVPLMLFADGPNLTTSFFVVSKPGLILDSERRLVWYLSVPGPDAPSNRGRYAFNVDLRPGYYVFYQFEDRDLVPFVTGPDWAQKLGYQEAHPDFIIVKDK